MSHAPLPPQEYYRSLPRHIAGAGVILHDPERRFLLVKPSYRATWEIPGGGMETGEYPQETARREVMEELGLELTLGRLLAVDWVPPQADGRPALANYLFDGGLVKEDQIRGQIRLQDDELTDWTLAAPVEWDSLLVPHMTRRLRACASALETGTTPYLQHGWEPAAVS
jgi:8-oxo-dGTP pyrophosphatase MutT (NUDIX family)